MGVGICLNGRFPVTSKAPDAAAVWLKSLETWFDDHVLADPFWGNFNIRTKIGTTHAGDPALLVSVYPASEDIEFIVPAPGHITVAAKTSTAGPGYHTALCRLVRWFGETMNVRWNPPTDDDPGDETGYFFTEDRDLVEQTMLGQIKAMAEITLEHEPDLLQSWNMGIDVSYSKYPGELRTPVGVRSRDWIEHVAADPVDGRDVYPWWDEGLTAGFYLGRALCELWTTIRWSPPISGDEYDAWDWTCSDLCRAYRLDPHLAYPWREWAELIDLLDEYEGATDVDEPLDQIIREKAAAVSETIPLIGYRRFPIDVRLLDGWTIEIPGTMASEWKDDAWSAWDGNRTVWFKCWSVRQADDSPVPAESMLSALAKDNEKPLSFQSGDLFGIAFRQEVDEDGKPLLNLGAYTVVDGKYALFNFFLTDPNDFDWAVATWRSVKCPPPPE